MTQTNALIANTLVRENVSPGSPVDLTSRPTDLYNLLLALGLVRDVMGAHPLEWNVTYATTSGAEIFVENQALGAAGRRTMAKASLSPFYVRTQAAVTGHVMDQIRNGGTHEDVLQGEIGSAVKDLFYLMEQTLTGSTANRGIASIIDAGDTYAGLAPGSYSTWASLETAVGGALTAAVMYDTQESLINAPYNATTTVILMPPNQVTNYLGLGGLNGGTSVSRLMLNGGPQSTYDIGIARGGASFNGIPIASVRNVTTTEIYWLDLTDQKVGEGQMVPGVTLQMVRGLKAEPLAKTDDNERVMLSMGGCLKVVNRRVQGKLTGVTA